VQILQLVGRRAGDTMEMPYAIARRCIEMGTASQVADTVEIEVAAQVEPIDPTPDAAPIVAGPPVGEMLPRRRGRPRKTRELL